jgi:AhpD family alkylhydroperoxidase
MSKTGVGKGSIFTPAVAELVAIGASMAANCKPCLNHHVAQARKLGVSDDDIRKASGLAQMVKKAPATAVLELAEKLLGDGAAEYESADPSPCRDSSAEGGRGR